MTTAPHITGDDVVFTVKYGEIKIEDFKTGHPVYEHVAKMYPYDEEKMMKTAGCRTTPKECMDTYYAQLRCLVLNPSAPVVYIGKDIRFLAIQSFNPLARLGYLSVVIHLTKVSYDDVNNRHPMKQERFKRESFQIPVEFASEPLPFETKCPTCSKCVNVYTRDPCWMTPEQLKGNTGSMEVDFVECPDAHYRWKMFTYDEYINEMRMKEMWGKSIVPSASSAPSAPSVPSAPSAPSVPSAPVISLSVHEELIAKLKKDFESKLKEMNEYYTSLITKTIPINTNIEKESDFPVVYGCGAGASAIATFTTLIDPLPLTEDILKGLSEGHTHQPSGLIKK